MRDGLILDRTLQAIAEAVPWADLRAPIVRGACIEDADDGGPDEPPHVHWLSPDAKVRVVLGGVEATQHHKGVKTMETDLAAYHRGIALDARRLAARELDLFRSLPTAIEWRITRLREMLAIEGAALAALDAVDPEAAARLRRETVTWGETLGEFHASGLLSGRLDRALPPSPEAAELLGELRGLADRVRGLAARMIGPGYAAAAQDEESAAGGRPG